MQCPACMTPLVTDCIDTVVLFGCLGCRGTLIPRRDLARVIDVLMREVPELADRPVQAMPDRGHARTCPRCEQAMQPFGYLGSHTVTLDRCQTDDLVWADASELEMMARMAAHNDRRHQGQHQSNMKRLERMTPQVDASSPAAFNAASLIHAPGAPELMTPTERAVVKGLISMMASSGD